jgi:phage baseplate assembly protein W
MNIDYPFHFNRQGRTAATSDADHIRDMVEQLLFTVPGERVNRPDMGSGLLQMVFEPNSPELAATLQYLVQSNLNQYLGELIQLEAVEVTSQDASLTVTVRYLIRRTQEQRTEQFRRSL